MRADLHFFERFLIEVRRVRIQPRQHAVNGFGDELFVFDWLDVIAFDTVENFREGAQLFNRQRQHGAGGAIALRHRRKVKADGDADYDASDYETELTQFVTHVLLQFP